MKNAPSGKHKEELTSLVEFKEMLNIFEGGVKEEPAWSAYVTFKDFAWFIVRIRVDWALKNFQIEFKDSAPARSFRARWEARQIEGAIDYAYNSLLKKPDFRTLVISWRLEPRP